MTFGRVLRSVGTIILAGFVTYATIIVGAGLFLSLTGACKVTQGVKISDVCIFFVQLLPFCWLIVWIVVSFILVRKFK